MDGAAVSADMGESLRRPRTIPQLIADTFRLYRRFPLLFLVLAGGVVVPYQLIVLAATGTGPFNFSDLSASTNLLLTVIDTGLITALVSAMHVQAVAEVREGGVPRVVPVARRGLGVLPVVAVAAIVANLGFLVPSALADLGFTPAILLTFPSIYLVLRWAVVAQTAAIEHEGWLQALRSSWALTGERVWHVLGFLILVGLITSVPFFLVRIPFSHEGATAASVLVGVLARVAVLSFSALAEALLYYDLCTRSGNPARVGSGASGNPRLG